MDALFCLSIFSVSNCVMWFALEPAIIVKNAVIVEIQGSGCAAGRGGGWGWGVGWGVGGGGWGGGGWGGGGGGWGGGTRLLLA